MWERLFKEHLSGKEGPKDAKYRHLERRHEASLRHLLLGRDGPLTQVQTVAVVPIREVVNVVARD